MRYTNWHICNFIKEEDRVNAMKKTLIPLTLALGLLSGCGAPAASSGEDREMTVVATTYPIYLCASALTDGVSGVRVERLNTGSVSCLHDYTLSVSDMKKLEGADLLAINGVGLDEFMEDALNRSSAGVVDCSQGVTLLENLSHLHEEGEDDHDHGHYDPHYWMDPENLAVVVDDLTAALTAADAGNAEAYRANAEACRAQLLSWDETFGTMLDGADIPGLVTFHDGFQYFAAAYGLPLLESIEEEAGSEASAREIVEITALVNDLHLPVIFTEHNGSDATARAISRETGCGVGQLSMIMDGEGSDLTAYYDAQLANVTAVLEGFSGTQMGGTK